MPGPGLWHKHGSCCWFPNKGKPKAGSNKTHSVFHQVFDSGTQRIGAPPWAVSCALRLLWCVSMHSINNNCISLFHVHILKINALRSNCQKVQRWEHLCWIYFLCFLKYIARIWLKQIFAFSNRTYLWLDCLWEQEQEERNLYLCYAQSPWTTRNAGNALWWVIWESAVLQNTQGRVKTG